MFCRQCGVEVKEGAQFCPQCGTQLGLQEQQAQPAQQEQEEQGQDQPSTAASSEPTGGNAADMSFQTPPTVMADQQPAAANAASPTTPQGSPQAKKKANRTKVIAGALVAIAIVAVGVGVGVWWKTDQDAKAAAAAERAAYEHAHTSVVTKVEAEAPGFDDASTAIPVQIVGTDLDGNSINEVQFMRPSNMSITTLQGSYDITFPGGYFTGSGQVMKAPGSTQHLNPVVDAPSEGSGQPTLEKVTYTEVPALEATEDVINDIISWTKRDPEDNGKADQLGTTATTAHNDAVAAEEQRKREEEERRAAEEAARAAQAARHYSSSCVELDLPASWVGEVTGDTMDHTSGMYHVDFIYGDYKNSGHYFMIFRVDGVHGNEGNHGIPQGSASWGNLGQIIWQSRHGGAKSSMKFSDSELEHIVDLMTGGALSLNAFDNAKSESECVSIAKPVVDNFMNSTIVPTIKYK